MRVLATTHPASGHLHPIVPILRKLTERGHEVTVATARSFCPTVEAVGFAAVPVGVDWLESEADTTLPGFLESGTAGGVEWFTRLASASCEDLERAAGELDTDLVLRESVEFGGWVAAERLGIPHVEVGINIATGGTIMAGLAPTGFAEMLEVCGLPPDPELRRATEHLYLDFLPPSFTPEWMDPGPTRKSYRAEIFDASGDEGVPDWWDEVRRSDNPVVYVTLGTVFNRTPTVFERVIEAFGDGDVQAVLTVGRNFDTTALGTTPANVRIERYIPQSLILGDCDVIVSHAGCGTLIAALDHQLPLVCLPFSADQPFNSMRVEELGLGVSLAHGITDKNPFPVVDEARLDPEQIRAAVHRVLDEPGYREVAGALRAEMQSLPDLDAAADAVEAIV